MPGEASDVHLVDDHVLHRAAERLVSLPVVVAHVDDHAAHGGRQIVGRPDGIIAVEKLLRIAQGIRVNQHVVAVKAKSLTVEILWPVNTVRVMSTRLEALDVDVPEKESLVDGGIELDDLDRLDVIVPLKQKQL